MAKNSFPYSKTLEESDREVIEEIQHVENVEKTLKGIPHRFEHPLRSWEYGIAINALRSIGAKTVLDVGGGGSVFAPAASWKKVDMKVTQVDPGECDEWVKQQESRLDLTLPYVKRDFLRYNDNKVYDGVVCLSVLEHVEDDTEFFEKLLSFVKDGGLLILTIDYHPTSERQLPGHIRTYNARRLQELSLIAKQHGFTLYGPADYTNWHPNVNGYTFASLVLQKVRTKSEMKVTAESKPSEEKSTKVRKSSVEASVKS